MGIPLDISYQIHSETQTGEAAFLIQIVVPILFSAFLIIFFSTGHRRNKEDSRSSPYSAHSG